MFVFFSVSCLLLKHLRKAFILFWSLGVLSCTDFKSWESVYAPKVKITFKEEFEQKKYKKVFQVCKNLQTYKLSKLTFIKQPILSRNDQNLLLKNSLYIRLDPDADAVSFELESKDNMYYQKVIIHYTRMVSLISIKAGGFQIQYVIKRVQLHTKDNSRPIFKQITIDNPIPLQEEKEQTHVTLYY